MPDPSTDAGRDAADEPGVEIEAPTFSDAVREASERLGVPASEIALNVLDPGRSAASAAGYRPVKLRAWIRPRGAAPDGARPASARPARERRGDEDRERRGDEDRGRIRGPGRLGGEAERYGPPLPPLDPEKITPAHVELARSFAAGIARGLGFPAEATAERSKHGIRVAIEAGERDPLLIGPEGETLAAIQHLLARMMRARAGDERVPRVEVDVAGYRDRRDEELRELARELIEQVRRDGGEASTEPLPPSERRIVHLEVAEAAGMASFSVGAHLEKRVIVRRADEGPPASEEGGA